MHLSIYQAFHIFIVFGLLTLVYFFASRALNVRGTRWRRIRLYVANNLVEQSILQRLLTHEPTDHLFRSSGLPANITSYRYNLARFQLIGVVMVVYIFTTGFGMPLLSRNVAMMLVFILILLSGRKPFLGYQLLDFLRKKYLRDVNNEVYSLFIQLKTEYSSNENIDNVYNLLLSYRKYFDKIRPAIEKALSRWNNIDGSERAWDAFAKEVGTPEANSLAIVMKEVDNIPREEAAELLTQKHVEFAKKNYNAFNQYLQNRANIIYVVVYLCALGVFANMAVAQYLQYSEIMQFMNTL